MSEQLEESRGNSGVMKIVLGVILFYVIAYVIGQSMKHGHHPRLSPQQIRSITQDNIDWQAVDESDDEYYRSLDRPAGSGRYDY
jgi:hypothetical protein